MAETKKQAAAKPRTRTAKKATSAAPKQKSAEADATTTPASEVNGAKTAKATSAAKAATTASAPKSAAKPVQQSSKPTPATPPTPPTQTTQTTQTTHTTQTTPTTQATAESGKRVSVTIPLDSAVAGLAIKAATLPVSAAKKVAQNRNGIPAYVAVGGLAVIGAVEWPVAAVGGLGLAAMRRWGPLKPARNQGSKKGA